MSVKIKGCVNVDADEFLNDFLELQDQSCGPTVCPNSFGCRTIPSLIH